MVMVMVMRMMRRRRRRERETYLCDIAYQQPSVKVNAEEESGRSVKE